MLWLPVASDGAMTNRLGLDAMLQALALEIHKVRKAGVTGSALVSEAVYPQIVAQLCVIQFRKTFSMSTHPPRLCRLL